MSALLTPVQHLLEVTANVTRQEKNKRPTAWKLRNINVPIEDIIVHVENPKESFLKIQYSRV